MGEIYQRARKYVYIIAICKTDHIMYCNRDFGYENIPTKKYTNA
jgi:hypothetical protein